MTRRALVLWAVGVALLCARPARAAQVLDVTPSALNSDVYDMIELFIDVDADFDNPYDPEQIAVDVAVTAPSGDVMTFPAFWDEPMERSLDGGTEVWTPAGDAGWRARFTPRAQGMYSFTVSARDADGTDVADPVAIFAYPPAHTGFARVHPKNARYFVLDGGGTLVPLGMNIDWATEASGTYAYDDYLSDLAAGGGNWTRLWMTHFGNGWSLEWNADHGSGDYHGLGVYNQVGAARIDHVLETARDLGVYLQLVLHQHSQFLSPSWSSWDDNPYNAANGGPCATSLDYFTDAEAARLAADLHRYTVARWHAFTSLFSWEIWNEADGIVGVTPGLMNPWTEEAAAAIRDMDPAEHMVSTSYASPVPFPGFDLEIGDFNNRHIYAYGSWIIPFFTGSYFHAGMPVLLSEFGVDWAGTADDRDTLGVNLHNGVWSAVMNGYAGGAMNWWWDNYIEPQDLWGVNEPMKTFLADIDLALFDRGAAIEAGWGDNAAEAYALASPGPNSSAWLVWVHDRTSGWLGPMDSAPTVTGAAATLTDLSPDNPALDPAATLRVRVFDPWTGDWLADAPVSADADSLTVALPTFTRDLALRVTAVTPTGDDDTTDDDTLDDDADDDDAGDDDLTDDDAGDDDGGGDDAGSSDDGDDGGCCG